LRFDVYDGVEKYEAHEHPAHGEEHGQAPLRAPPEDYDESREQPGRYDDRNGVVPDPAGVGRVRADLVEGHDFCSEDDKTAEEDVDEKQPEERPDPSA
jgi:hypothetical protein